MDVLRLAFAVGTLSSSFLALAACGASHAADRARPTAAASSSGSGASSSPAVALDAGQPTTTTASPESSAPDVTMDWGTPSASVSSSSGGNGPLFAIADGMCVNAQVFPIQGGAIFTYGNGEYINWETSNPTMITTAYVGENGITPDRSRGFGAALDAEGGTLGTIGGAYPDHMFAVIDFASRAMFARQLRVGSATKPTGWKTILGSSSRDPLTPSGFTAVANPIPWTADGSYLVATDTAGVRNNQPDDPPDVFAFRVLLPDGTLAVKPKVPGPDLGSAAFRIEPRAIARLANGEVVGIGWDKKKKLIRWSPTKPVDDVPFPVAPATAKSDALFRGGKSRAVIALDDALYIYDGTAGLVAAKVNPKLGKGFAWTIGADDEIIVIQPSGAVIEEPMSGPLREQDKLPFAATFGNVPSGIPWGIASGKGNQGSDALVRKNPTTNRWEVVALPTPPFGSDARAPLKVTNVNARDATDVFVIAQRSEPGYGWKHPPSFRAIYRTKRPHEVVRCQDAPHAWTGTGTHRWPPAANDNCKTPVVVASFGDSTAKGYPTIIASSLRGKTQFGETLSFVTFEGRGTTNLGIVMTDVAKARAVATHLSSLGLRPEVSCGKPTAVRSFTLDVAKGTFTQ